MLLIDTLQNVAGDAWRDRTALNGPLMRAAFPSSPIENSDWWADMLRLSSSTFVFERAMLVDRAAAHKRCVYRFQFNICALTNLIKPALYELA